MSGYPLVNFTWEIFICKRFKEVHTLYVFVTKVECWTANWDYENLKIVLFRSQMKITASGSDDQIVISMGTHLGSSDYTSKWVDRLEQLNLRFFTSLFPLFHFGFNIYFNIEHICVSFPISVHCTLKFPYEIWTNATEPCWLIFRKSPKVKYQICQSSWRTLLITDITSRTDPKKDWNFFSVLLLLSVAFWPAAHFPCILSIQFFVHTLVISLCTH